MNDALHYDRCGMTYRLLKVICQAVFVSEDADGNLIEHTAEPAVISASEWPTYSTGRFASDLEALNTPRSLGPGL